MNYPPASTLGALRRTGSARAARTAVFVALVIALLASMLSATPDRAEAQTYSEGPDYSFFFNTYGPPIGTIRHDWNLYGGPTGLPYYINQQVIDDGFEDAVKNAFATFENDPGSNISFVYMGATTAVSEVQISGGLCCANPTDGINVVSYGQIPAGSIGRGGFAGQFFFDPATGIPTGEGDGEFDVTLAPSVNWTIGAQPGAIDMESLVLHELGHALGLNHPSTNSATVMWDTLPANTIRRNLHPADQAGLAVLYPAPPAAPILGAYVPLAPERLLDTRPSSQWGPGETRTVPVAGVGAVPADAVGVALNVTTVDPGTMASLSWLNAYPSDGAPTTAAVHNFGTGFGATPLVNSLLQVGLGADGAFKISNANGEVHLVIDVVGYYKADTGSRYRSVAPNRILDTRAGTQVGAYTTPWSAGTARNLTVAGTGLVPSTATAVAMHITTVSPGTMASISWLNVYPAGTSGGNAAVHNFGSGPATAEVVNDLVVAKVGANQQVAIENAYGDVDLVIDIVGYFTSDASAALYEPIVPRRMIDSRSGSAFDFGPYTTPWAAGQTRPVLQGLPSSCEAVAMHVTSLDPGSMAAFSWLTLGAVPSATAVHNFGSHPVTGSLVNDLIFAPVEHGGTANSGSVSITNANGDVHLIIDVVGLFSVDGSCDLAP